jgi:hypothetical protein
MFQIFKFSFFVFVYFKIYNLNYYNIIIIDQYFFNVGTQKKKKTIIQNM